ncbi:MAG TPA: sigma-70 family RNA polymerase sigma factor, partial [Actinomycetota bacterium]|nr:sigma-70 family RNA polymerase sigma factor [Actinomycetota bacterium]
MSELANGNGVAPLNGRSVDRSHAKDLFRRFVETRSPALREELVGLHLPLVEYLARRFRNRGEPLEDLVQVGTIGLLKAIDRFDLGREVEFSTYATPTIVGELKRHFRDKGWAVRVPRRLQELNLSLNKVVAELSQEIGRSPTVAEIATKARL